jgi:hypothetical protein
LPMLSSAGTVGVQCTTAPGNNFVLETKTGDIQLPDGNTMHTWGYSVQGQTFQHPGPVLCVTEGQPVSITLVNTLPQAVSIMFPGQENVLANGVQAQPEFDTNGRATSLTSSAAATTGVVQYSFTASKPGTYLYESGTNPQKQVRMGLFGTLIVRPVAADQMYDSPDTKFTTPANSSASYASGSAGWDEEFLVLLSEIDPYLNMAVEANPLANFNFNNYKPRYWLLNGRGLPDTLADNNASFLPVQPYGSMARIHPLDSTIHPYPGAIRYLNVGSEDFPYHPHGNNGAVIGRDGSQLLTSEITPRDASFEKFVIPVGPGQTWDVLFSWHDAENYSTTNPVDINIPQIANQFFGAFYNFSPYLGVQGQTPPNWSTLNTCGEYYIISHNHALYQLTSWGGLVMQGPGTYTRVDPPVPNNCAP